MPREELDRNTWRNRDYWDNRYDGISTPENEQQEFTRNAETVRDSLLGKDEDTWNRGSHGWHNCDYTDNQHAVSQEQTDTDSPAMTRQEANALLDFNQWLNGG